MRVRARQAVRAGSTVAKSCGGEGESLSHITTSRQLGHTVQDSPVGGIAVSDVVIVIVVLLSVHVHESFQL